MKTLEQYTESFRFKYERFLIGCDAIEEMKLWDKEALGEMEAYYANDLTGVIIRLIAADGKITQREVEYLNKTFGFAYTRQELEDVYNWCAEDIRRSFDESFENGITYMRRINEKLAEAYRELLALVCEIIIQSDGMIAEAEVAEVERLKAMCE